MKLHINDLITYLEQTLEDSWRMGTCRSKDQKTHCVMSHIFNWGGGDEKNENGYSKGGQAWDWFENIWATTYMVYPVNDGENKKYQQATPKQRCLAYIKDLRDGKEKTTLDYEKEHTERARRDWS